SADGSLLVVRDNVVTYAGQARNGRYGSGNLTTVPTSTYLSAWYGLDVELTWIALGTVEATGLLPTVEVVAGGDISSLSGILLHLEGTSLGADATSISTWPDLGPLGNDADLNGATAPVVDDGATPTGAKAATFSASSSPLTALYGLGSWAAEDSSRNN